MLLPKETCLRYRKSTIKGRSVDGPIIRRDLELHVHMGNFKNNCHVFSFPLIVVSIYSLYANW
jgi:hypothetical protein